MGAKKKRRDESRLLVRAGKLEGNAQTELNPAATLRAIGWNQFLTDDAEGGRALELSVGWKKLTWLKMLKKSAEISTL